MLVTVSNGQNLKEIKSFEKMVVKNQAQIIEMLYKSRMHSLKKF